uniref:VWFA domain-containing protein n=1 Tax=Panagrellus redivivus TaxID=6233 RepID=A0A7E4VD82_PANRE
MIEAYRNEVLQTVCILSKGSTMFYLDARKYNSSKKLNMKQVSTIPYTDASSLREALNSIADAENTFISTVVIVDTGSTADEMSALHGLVLDYAFKVYVIPTLMARIVASFDLYFKEGQIDYNYNQKFRLLTCGNGIESTRLDRENASSNVGCSNSTFSGTYSFGCRALKFGIFFDFRAA